MIGDFAALFCEWSVKPSLSSSPSISDRDQTWSDLCCETTCISKLCARAPPIDEHIPCFLYCECLWRSSLSSTTSSPSRTASTVCVYEREPEREGFNGCNLCECICICAYTCLYRCVYVYISVCKCVFDFSKRHKEIKKQFTILEIISSRSQKSISFFQKCIGFF